MSKNEIRGLEVQDAINVIRQKHLKDLDAEDIAFLRANEGMLSEVDKNIYFEGMSPKKAAQEASTVFNSRNDRIIHENRELQAKQEAEMAAKNATPAVFTLTDEEAEEVWNTTITSLNAQADKLEDEAEEAAKAAKKAAKEGSEEEGKKASKKK